VALPLEQVDVHAARARVAVDLDWMVRNPLGLNQICPAFGWVGAEGPWVRFPFGLDGQAAASARRRSSTGSSSLGSARRVSSGLTSAWVIIPSVPIT